MTTLPASTPPPAGTLSSRPLRVCGECLLVFGVADLTLCPVCASELAIEHSRLRARPAANPLRALDGHSSAWTGQTLVDLHGGRLGTIVLVAVDPETDICWLMITVDRYASSYTLVPANGASSDAGQVSAPQTRTTVRSAPRSLDGDCYLDGAFRSLHYLHYRLQNVPRRRTTRHGDAGMVLASAL
ncbi:MAG TPA: hypothetical protein VGN69_06750 [Solirubrobacteraceae bacterium]|nr:hypothetical protein [Solirubrobacteraceae bacterium]